MVTITEPTPVEHKKLANTNVSLGSENLEFVVKAGHPIFLVGPNGVGKSALINYLACRLGMNVIYQPSSRPNYFDTENLNLTPATRRNLTDNLRSWNAAKETRYRSIAGTMRNEKAIHDLQNAEIQYKVDAANSIADEGEKSTAIIKLQAKNSPLERLNQLLKQSNLAVSLTVVSGELRAERNGSIYSYARLSDGERAALIFAADVIAAPAESIFLIDEPESHLHPSIAVPLLKVLILERPDCGFVISTHQLELPTSTENRSIFLVRSCTWQNDEPTSWDLQQLTPGHDLPQELIINVLGSKDKILFIEGDSASLDQPLYSLLFPKASICPKKTCKDVIQAVVGLRSTLMHHKVQAFGVIDGDGMAIDIVKEFESKGIFVLPVYSVESLYYSVEVIQAVAELQAKHHQMNADTLYKNAIDAALNSINKSQITHLVSRIVERRLRDSVFELLPDRKRLIDNPSNNFSINVPTNYSEELKKLEGLIEGKKAAEILSLYPIRESSIPGAIVSALHLVSRDDYERLALAEISRRENIQSSLKQKLVALTNSL